MDVFPLVCAMAGKSAVAATIPLMQPGVTDFAHSLQLSDQTPLVTNASHGLSGCSCSVEVTGHDASCDAGASNPSDVLEHGSPSAGCSSSDAQGSFALSQHPGSDSGSDYQDLSASCSCGGASSHQPGLHGAVDLEASSPSNLSFAAPYEHDFDYDILEHLILASRDTIQLVLEKMREVGISI